MESHPSYEILAPFLKRYPGSAASLFQTYNDLTYAQEWAEMGVTDLGGDISRAAIHGRRKRGLEEGGGFQDMTSYAVPCSLSEVLSFEKLHSAFSRLKAKEYYLAITSEDASIVYYKLSDGIVKPPV
ncbi:tRNA intron endonuclease [Coprinopsis sp. MPI-PUGE-AT-0042]|nr:tRNA intron endonuclease [Coprinopsis sp. MPI-PUGE-AT-0042]